MFLSKSLDTSKTNVRQEGARYALFILTCINLLNYADRYVPSAVKTLIQEDLHLSDAESALPTTGMVVVYAALATLFGWANDYEVVDRRVLLAIAIVFWSAATALAGLATDLTSLVLLRSLVGVGEAAYGTIAPPMLSDFYPLHERQIAFAIYYLAIPVGAALGFGIGAIVASIYSWRVAYYVCGIPGLIVAISVMRIYDPARGVNDHGTNYSLHSASSAVAPMHSRVADEEDDAAEDGAKAGESRVTAPSTRRNQTAATYAGMMAEFKEILTNSVFMFTVMGYAASAFALGGIAEWYATYLLRYTDATLSSAGLVSGAATIVGGILGNLLGCKVADYYDDKVKSSYLLIPGLFCIPAAICCIWAVNTVGSAGPAYAALFLCQIFAWTQIGPITAVSISCVPPHLRARSTGILILLQHFLGDVISPPIIGGISDATGSLATGMQCTWIAFLVCALWWCAAAFFLRPVSYSVPTAGQPPVATVTYWEILSK